MENNTPERQPIGEVLRKYKEQHGTANTLAITDNMAQNAEGANMQPQIEQIRQSAPQTPEPIPVQQQAQPTQSMMPPPANGFNPKDFESAMSKETDPDLMTSYEIIKLPSQGLFYANRLSEVEVEYMTSKDEDLLTTPSLIENNTVLDILLKRKIKTKGVSADSLLTGDRNAIILFLRSSSYGPDYQVTVPDPRTNIPFKETVDLLKLKYKRGNENPDDNGYFMVNIPMRKKTVKFRLLTSGEENMIAQQAEALKEAYGQEYSEYSTLKLKAHVISINDKSDRTYINKFIDAMPALDALTIRRKILDVSPDVDMEYEFTAKDGYKFKTQLSVGVDFFFPNT